MMSCNCESGSCSCKTSHCGVKKITLVLVIIGGLNWGLVGAGMLAGTNLNLVNLIFGSWPMVEAVIYILVGLAALVKIFGCPCKKCKECAHSSAMPEKAL